MQNGLLAYSQLVELVKLIVKVLIVFLFGVRIVVGVFLCNFRLLYFLEFSVSLILIVIR